MNERDFNLLVDEVLRALEGELGGGMSAGGPPTAPAVTPPLTVHAPLPPPPPSMAAGEASSTEPPVFTLAAGPRFSRPGAKRHRENTPVWAQEFPENLLRPEAGLPRLTAGAVTTRAMEPAPGAIPSRPGANPIGETPARIRPYMQELPKVTEEYRGHSTGSERRSGGRREPDRGERGDLPSVQTSPPRAVPLEAFRVQFPTERSGEPIVPKRIGSAATGVFATIDEAVSAAELAFVELHDLTLEQRGELVAAIRKCALENKEDFARRTRDETGMGRVDHKMLKFDIVATKTPGIEILQPGCFTGDHGLTVDELAPFGVVGAVTPVTHPVPTLVNNAISFIAAGNACVFNAHPQSRRVFAHAVEKLNAAIQAAGGPANLITCVREPSIETGQMMFEHPNVRLLLVTGGPAVVRAAVRAPKRAICAGPGNPPVVVDETACLRRAAKGIIEGGGFDNNILCIGEKEIFVVDGVADALMGELAAQGCHRLDPKQVGELTRVAFPSEGRRRDLNRSLIGRDAKVLASHMGLTLDYDPPLLFGETDFEHPFVQYEQMMPFIPVVRCRDVSQAVTMAIEAEHGYGHTAVIHSRNIQTMHEMARRVNTTIFVKNGASTAGLGWGGEGYTSFSIAGPTGEGLTTARTFTRSRRCALVDYFRIV